MLNVRTTAPLALCASLALLAGCGAASSAPDTPRTTAAAAKASAAAPAPAAPNAAGSTRTSPEPASAPRPAAEDLFGPNSYHGVEIGMTLAQAKATGATVIKVEADQGGCTLVRSQGSTAPAGEPDVTLSPSGRVSDLAADGTSAVTPDGIRLGSSKADVLKAWPKAQHTPDFWVAPVPDNPKAQYLFDFDTAHGTLAGLLLTSTDRDDCAN